MRRILASALVALGLLAGLSACQPAVPPVGYTPTPLERWVANTGDQATINRMIVGLWGDNAWCMERIVNRESNYTPTAYNPSGSAGLTQLLLPLHNDLFYAVGSYPGNWGDAWTNLRAAYLLWQGAGFAPWTPVPC